MPDAGENGRCRSRRKSAARLFCKVAGRAMNLKQDHPRLPRRGEKIGPRRPEACGSAIIQSPRNSQYSPMWYVENRVSRGVYIAISLIAILLLVKPLDCFSNGQFTQKSADCCKKGKCVPSSNADDCCKGTVPGDGQFVTSKALHSYAPALDLIAATAPGPIDPAFATVGFADVEAPPGSPPTSRIKLPLLI
jgi:hypothetical protein